MATYYVDPSVGSSGDGLSQGTALKYLSEIPYSTGHTVLFRADSLVHRPSDTIPSNLTICNFALMATATLPRSLGASTTFGSYGTGNPILSGAVLWTGSVGSQSLNSLTCKVFQHTVAVSPFWFPRSDRVATYPSICCPTNDDGVDDFIDQPADFDNVAQGVGGFRFPGTANFGSTTDPTKEIYYEAVSGGYEVTIRKPGFWSRADAVADLVGYPVLMRTSSNLTTFFGTIQSYDSVDGSVVVFSKVAPYNTTSGPFFYALVAHPYGLRKNLQYAMTEGIDGWTVAMPDGSAYDIACYSSIYYCAADGVTWDTNVVFEHEASAHGNTTTRGGCLVYLNGGSTTTDNFTVGDLIQRQVRNFNRDGSVIGTGAGSVGLTVIAQGAVTQRECMGVKLCEFANNGVSSNITVTGPLISYEGGAGVRLSGETSSVTIGDFVLCPRASVHDNGLNTYGACYDTVFQNGVVVGSVNPGANQYTSSTRPATDINRTYRNIWLSGRPKMDLSGYETIGIYRHDNGGYGNVLDRVFSVNGGSTTFGWASGTKPNTGMVIQRCILDKLGRGSSTDGNTFSGMTFRHCVFTKKASAAVAYATVQAYIEAFGGTVENCVELDFEFAGTITDDMWQKLTLNDALTAYEAVNPWLAPQLGLSLPAYGSARTLVAPVLISTPLRVGHPANMMIGTLINPNPLAEMSLPAGVEDNDKLYSTLYGGINIIPSVSIPDQEEFVIAVDVTDTGATNGPLERFLYTITVGATGAAGAPVEGDPPPAVVIRGHALRLKLF